MCSLWNLLCHDGGCCRRRQSFSQPNLQAVSNETRGLTLRPTSTDNARIWMNIMGLVSCPCGVPSTFDKTIQTCRIQQDPQPQDQESRDGTEDTLASNTPQVGTRGWLGESLHEGL